MHNPADHQEQFASLINHLDAEGWQVSALEITDARPFPGINVAIPDDSGELLWNIELSFLPIATADLPDAKVLQYFVPLANQFERLEFAALSELLGKINAKLPLGAFGFMDDFSLLYYKYNLMLPVGESGGQYVPVSRALGMITYLVSSFTGPLFLVASGQRDVATAIQEMPFTGIF
jgi:hypothetical protein